MKKTLFVSDLDGTLLLPNATLSFETSNTINFLCKKGMIFSYATARSIVTAQEITKALSNVPAIVYNGTFIYKDGKRICEHYFSEENVNHIAKIVDKYKVYPIVYAFYNDKERYSYIPKLSTTETKEFVNTRNDFRRTQADTIKQLFLGNVFHYSFIGTEKNIFPIYEALKNHYPCNYYNEIYSGHQWLEIQPKNVTKATAINDLKKLLNCTKVISFGDAVNDIPMFEVADDCYAVENADNSVKALATGIIESNSQNGVAKFLSDYFSKLST